MINSNQPNAKRIILTGGGTGGSVIPLLAIAKMLKSGIGAGYIYEFLWVGTKNGPERALVEAEGVRFKAIHCGKWRRYLSLKNFIDLFKTKIGFFQSLAIILRFKPDLIICAGSFCGVPVVWAGWLLKIPSLVHQQDVLPGLANKVMAPFARVVSVTFEKSLADYGAKAVRVGNFIRQEFFDYRLSKAEARQKLGLRDDLPTLLVMGGGTGASYINSLVAGCAEVLTKACQTIILTGRGKGGDLQLPKLNFKAFPFLNTDGFIKVLYAADIVISRCGMGVLTELSFLGKPAILIPLPDSHQDANASAFAEADAAIVLRQQELDNQKLVKIIKELIADKNRQIELGKNIKKVIKIDSENSIVSIIEKLII